MEIHTVVFWIMTPCSLVGGCHRFGETCCFGLHRWKFHSNSEDGSSVLLRNADAVSTWLTTMAELRRPSYEVEHPGLVTQFYAWINDIRVTRERVKPFNVSCRAVPTCIRSLASPSPVCARVLHP
jgi:hypothetical protein